MPTPFYHLSVAEDLLRHPALSPDVKYRLVRQRCPFLFGNTAPDVQVCSGQPREATHFFTLPLRERDLPAWKVFLGANPFLANGARLSHDHAAFMAGYLCHLQADWLWIKHIFAPVFGPDNSWKTFSYRLYLHNVLRAYLDRQVLPTPEEKIGVCLESVDPRGWLPFVKDEHLRSWRDYLSVQLQPGALVRTVEVFADRAGISPNDFYNLLESEDRMEEMVFVHLPRQKLKLYRQNLIDASVLLLNEFLAPEVNDRPRG